MTTYVDRETMFHGWVFSYNLMIDFVRTTPGVRAGELRYLGFPDTGYEVVSQGRERGRRQRADEGERLYPEYARRIIGQDVLLPSHVFCPVCGALNLVPLPEDDDAAWASVPYAIRFARPLADEEELPPGTPTGVGRQVPPPARAGGR